MQNFDPVAALARLAELAAKSPDDARLQAALKWACKEVAGADVERKEAA